MNMNFISVDTKLPELYDVLGLQVSTIVPVILKNKSYQCASLWNNTWRSAFNGEVIENVAYWGNLDVENSE